MGAKIAIMGMDDKEVCTGFSVHRGGITLRKGDFVKKKIFS
jgi:hypothetical protein